MWLHRLVRQGQVSSKSAHVANRRFRQGQHQQGVNRLPPHHEQEGPRGSGRGAAVSSDHWHNLQPLSPRGDHRHSGPLGGTAQHAQSGRQRPPAPRAPQYRSRSAEHDDPQVTRHQQQPGRAGMPYGAAASERDSNQHSALPQAVRHGQHGGWHGGRGSDRRSKPSQNRQQLRGPNNAYAQQSGYPP